MDPIADAGLEELLGAGWALGRGAPAEPLPGAMADVAALSLRSGAVVREARIS